MDESSECLWPKLQVEYEKWGWPGVLSEIRANTSVYLNTANKKHEEHIRGGYFQKNCNACALFLGQGLMYGRINFPCPKCEKTGKIPKLPVKA